MTPILAYIDPGSGALLWQSLTAALVGSMFYLRRFVKAFRNWKREGRKRES